MSEARNLSFAELSALIERFESGEPLRSLADFSGRLRSEGHEAWALAIDGVAEPSALGMRLLGVYTRLRYAEEMVKILAELVAFPTYREDGVEPHDSPAIHAIGKRIAELAAEYGLEFENIGPNRVFRTWLPGSGPQVISAYAHTDVVGLSSPQWTLHEEGGAVVDPFQLTPFGEKLYGRGAQDCKGSLVVALFALRVLREAGIEPSRRLMLTMTTAEETGGSGMRFLLQELQRRGESAPDCNIALDGNYPVQVAEKGYGVVSVQFDATPAASSKGKVDAEVVAITGSNAVNQICGHSVVTLTCAVQESKKVELALKTVAQTYRQAILKRGEVTIEMDSTVAGEFTVTITGASAHSSEPDSAVNPLSRAFGFVIAMSKQLSLRDNQWLAAARFGDDLFGLGYLGEKWGIAGVDRPGKPSAVDLGPLTICLTRMQKLDCGAAEVAANLRLPRGCDFREVRAAVQEKLADWQSSSGCRCRASYPADEWWNATNTDESQQWIHDLLRLFAEVTGQGAALTFDTGGSSARFFANSINFGPSMPAVEFEGHTDHEFKRRSQLLLDAQLVTEMFLCVGSA